MMQRTSGGPAWPGDLCYVLSDPHVECCVVIEQREARRSPLAMWFDSVAALPPRQARLRGWTGTALAITPLGAEERDGICSHRWRPNGRGQGRFFQRIGGRPSTSHGCPCPTGVGLPSSPPSAKFRRKIIFCRALGASVRGGPGRARRWWRRSAGRSRSFTSIRQKKLG